MNRRQLIQNFSIIGMGVSAQMNTALELVSNRCSREKSLSNYIPFHSYLLAEQVPFDKWLFRRAVEKGVQKVAQRALQKNKKISLFCGGGKDSAAIALCLKQLNVPFELVFVDFYGFNKQKRKQAKEISLLTKTSLTIVNVPRPTTNFLEFQNITKTLDGPYPTQIILSQVVATRFKNRFILMGDGDFKRRHLDIYSDYQYNPLVKEIPFGHEEVTYYNLKKKGIDGEFYFYKSSPELVAAMIKNPSYWKGKFSTDEIISFNFPELLHLNSYSNWSLEGRHVLDTFRTMASKKVSEAPRKTLIWKFPSFKS